MGAQVELQNILQSIDGHGTDQIAVHDADTVLRSLALDGLEDAVDGGLLIVSQVHGNLNDAVAVLQDQGDGADVLIAAGGSADSLDDLLADFQILGLQVDVKGDQGGSERR